MTSTVDAPVEVQPGSGGASGAVTAPAQRPRWGRWTQLAVAAVAGGLYLANLSVDALGNPYYAAAVKSGSVSWKAWFFGSIDPASFITVDKPPAAFWVQAISVRIFGFSSWSILVPQAVEGILAVAITYHLARRVLSAPVVGRAVGPVAAEVGGILAGVALAVTPIAAVMFRFNDPDALLALLLTAAAWAGWVAVERGSVRHLCLAGLAVGFAFLAKELVAAVVVPGLALAWIVAAPVGIGRRLLGWLWAGIVLVVSAGWWVAVVELLPASDRPYVASSTNNSILSVIFGYNGFSRVFGHGGGHGGVTRHVGDVVRGSGTSGFASSFAGRGGATFGGRGFSGGAFGGGAGWGRFFGDTLGTQISWLLPLAALGLVAGLAIAGRAGRTDLRRAGYLLLGGWAVAGFVVFSKSSGTFHTYYTIAVATPLALLAGAGAVELWALGRRRRSLAWVLPVAVAGSGVWAWELLDRTPGYHPWLRVAILVAAIASALAALAALATGVAAVRAVGWLAPAAAAVAACALLAGPTAWAISTDTHAGSSINPVGGPTSASTSGTRAIPGGGDVRRTGAGGAGFSGFSGFSGVGGAGFGGAGFGGSSSGPTAGDRSFVSWLEAHRGGATFLVAVDGSMSADDLIIDSGQPVMDMGGFSGSDPYPTLADFERDVAKGEVRYVLVPAGRTGTGAGRTSTGGSSGAAGFGGAGFGGAGFGGAARGSTVTSVLRWAEAHGTVVPTSEWGGGVSGTLYEVRA